MLFDLRHLKTTLDMEILKCKTAEMCEKELWVYFLAYNLIRLLMAEAGLRCAASIEFQAHIANLVGLER